jgi:flagellar assembly factor FliW
MTEQGSDEQKVITIKSARFGELVVSADTFIEFPGGIVGFPRQKKFVLLEHKPPFSWLHSTEDSTLAFVVVDGFEFGQLYDLKSPFSYKACDFRDEDEYAILNVVTVRSDPKATTVNIKAPLFINVRNRLGVQVIYDDPNLSTRHPLWQIEEGQEKAAQQQSAESKEGKGSLSDEEK